MASVGYQIFSAFSTGSPDSHLPRIVRNDDPIPDHLKAFLIRNLDSVAQLEALLLMRATAADVWFPSGLAARLYVADREAQAVLAVLHHRHFLQKTTAGGFRYEPASDELRDLVDTLAAAYPRHLIAITRLIHAQAPTAVRSFAEAFYFHDKEL